VCLFLVGVGNINSWVAWSHTNDMTSPAKLVLDDTCDILVSSSTLLLVRLSCLLMLSIRQELNRKKDYYKTQQYEPPSR